MIDFIRSTGLKRTRNWQQIHDQVTRAAGRSATIMIGPLMSVGNEFAQIPHETNMTQLFVDATHTLAAYGLILFYPSNSESVSED
jgi:hypothetical protein